jgi:hypothetical protein
VGLAETITKIGPAFIEGRKLHSEKDAIEIMLINFQNLTPFAALLFKYLNRRLFANKTQIKMRTTKLLKIRPNLIPFSSLLLETLWLLWPKLWAQTLPRHLAPSSLLSLSIM